MEPSNLFVVLMGIGTVFAGLIGIIIICTITGAIFRSMENKADKKPAAASEASASSSGDTIPNRGEFIAAVSAAIAEDMGKDVSAIRILSVKKLG